MGIQSQVSIRRANGKMAVQTYTIRTQPGPSLFPVADRQGADGLQWFRNGLSGRYHHLQQDRRRTFATSGRNLYQVTQVWIKNET